MKIKTETIINFVESGLALTKKYPMAMAWKMKLNFDACNAVYMAYEQQKRDLLEKYAKKDASGELLITDNMYTIENVDAWNREIGEIFETEIEVTISEIPAELLDKCDENFTVPELSIISFMIKEA